MFEKSLYDLIRGIRNHKGNEKEYIQNCLKECRNEIRGSDMDVKATALLKLIYLEMVGHDMSWASFHVLEVMSSAKYHQKRVGYLGAVQSFRPDTEVLMLATNLLKKDLSSASTTVISLPIAALPHVINPSLALSVLSDMLPRLSHSSPAIRKKTIVTLYRLALVYPETLRAAWPKIKERLMDKDEDSSVTSAIVNVVCELGWRRPRDFLPLAPRLFELLVDGGNNWMAIKLIKLFATLTPLEPRLVRKLLPPLTELIRTTPAMSLLYECINGIIQGGILGSADDASGREEIATLCVNKLRSMIMIDGDPNLKYVALLAFNKIVVTHPFLVSQQEDVILGCIDSPDITIRIKALDLVQGMVNGDNLMFIVGQLMRQLKAASSDERSTLSPPLDSYDETTTTPNITSRKDDNGTPPLPQDYRVDVIGRILSMCSQGNYSNVVDFDWYIDVLTSLVHMAPTPQIRDDVTTTSITRGGGVVGRDVSARIGDELRNIAVKVKAMRGAAVRAAGMILERLNSDTPSGHSIISTALKPIAWILGEYAAQITHPQDTLAGLLQAMPRMPSPDVLAGCLQAVPKVFAIVAAQDAGRRPWTSERKSLISLLLARILHTIEPLTLSPDLEVQERAVEFHELLKLTAEAVSGQAVAVGTGTGTGEGLLQDQEAPLLLTQAIPSLFAGWELNSVARGAQHNVPQPSDLDLDQPIHFDLHRLLAQADVFLREPSGDEEPDEFDVYYNQKPPATSLSSGPAIDRLAVHDDDDEVVGSYQNQHQADQESYLDAQVLARRREERLQRNRDDPFYIPPTDTDVYQRASTPIHSILQSTNGPDLDIDNIPIMRLDLENLNAAPSQPSSRSAAAQTKPRRQKVVIATDETLAGRSGSGTATPSSSRNLESENSSDSFAKGRLRKPKQSLLQVDSSIIHSLSLEGDDSSRAAAAAAPGSYDYEQQQRDDAEMARAMKDIERLRLELQRSKERVEVPQGIDEAGIVVAKRARKPKKAKEEGSSSLGKKKKTSKPKEPADETTATAAGDDAVVVVPKKKKKKKVAEIQDLI